MRPTTTPDGPMWVRPSTTQKLRDPRFLTVRRPSRSPSRRGSWSGSVSKGGGQIRRFPYTYTPTGEGFAGTFAPGGLAVEDLVFRGPDNLWRFPLDGSAPGPVTAFASEQILNYRWSPDGKDPCRLARDTVHRRGADYERRPWRQRALMHRCAWGRGRRDTNNRRTRVGQGHANARLWRERIGSALIR